LPEAKLIQLPTLLAASVIVKKLYTIPM